MTGGDKQGKGVSDAEQTWMCFSNAKDHCDTVEPHGNKGPV